MQPHALVLGTDRQQPTDLAGVQPRDVAQHDHLPLLRRQCIDGVAHVGHRLLAKDAFFRDVGPRVRECLPHAVASEPFGVDRRPGRVAPQQRRKRKHPPFAALPAAGDVEGDAEDPCLQAGATLEPIQAADAGQPGLLDNVLRDGPVLDVAHGETDQRTVIALHERGEGVLVALLERVQLRRVALLAHPPPKNSHAHGHDTWCPLYARALQPHLTARMRETNAVPRMNHTTAPANTSRKPRKFPVVRPSSWCPGSLNAWRIGAKMAGASAGGSVNAMCHRPMSRPDARSRSGSTSQASAQSTATYRP